VSKVFDREADVSRVGVEGARTAATRRGETSSPAAEFAATFCRQDRRCQARGEDFPVTIMNEGVGALAIQVQTPGDSVDEEEWATRVFRQ